MPTVAYYTGKRKIVVVSVEARYILRLNGCVVIALPGRTVYIPSCNIISGA